MSRQLATYLAARADGAPVEIAAQMSGIGITEARLTEKAIESGEIELPVAQVQARTREDQSTKEREMVGGTVAGDELRLLIERVERLHEERTGLADDIKDVFQEAKSRGFDTATIKRILKLRKADPDKLQEAEALLETYMSALGMTPIEQAIALAA